MFTLPDGWPVSFSGHFFIVRRSRAGLSGPVASFVPGDRESAAAGALGEAAAQWRLFCSGKVQSVDRPNEGFLWLRTMSLYL